MTRFEGAFTLVELIIVIVLIGILSAIAAPKLTDLRHEATAEKNQTIYTAFRSGLENAMFLKDISKSSLANGALDINQDGVGDLFYGTGFDRYPNGAAKKLEDGTQTMSVLDGSNPINAEACIQIFNKLIQSDLKLVPLDTFDLDNSQCRAEKADLCVLAYYVNYGTIMYRASCSYFFTKDVYDDLLMGFSYNTINRPSIGNTPIFMLFEADIPYLSSNGDGLAEDLYWSHPEYILEKDDPGSFLDSDTSALAHEYRHQARPSWDFPP